ncbi:response regulator [Gilvimarinus sp. F26214L]|uniref:response regulator n=1 Tax=Gilvimarinus sp. DZF01 TaxID=3461371 RepID=UPI0040456D9A
MNERPNVVLVVDDSPESLGMVNDTLEQAGYDVLVALEGKQALSIAKRIRPDVILMDAIMPHKDGFDTTRELREMPELSAVPVIFMTGLSDSESVVRGLEAGGVDYLTKPIRPDELLARMNVHLNNARLTSSAFTALDSTGQYLLSVDRNGHILWATPQVHALFARARITESWQETELAFKIDEWLRHKPDPGQSIEVSSPPEKTPKSRSSEKSLSLTLVQILSANEILLKLSQVSNISGEELLKTKLNLTRRESQVLFWISNGKTNWEIGQILEMSPRTVNKHLEQIFPKLGVQNRTAAARIALSALGEAQGA